MSSVIEYSICSECGNPDKYSDYYYKTDELYESCDVCGYYRSVIIKNKPPKNEKYPIDWNPEYDEKEGRTGYVLKVFPSDESFVGHSVAFIEENQIENLISKLESDNNIKKFGLTYKNSKGIYLTQIFKNK